MKKILGLLGLVAACGVCCAFPLWLPLLGGFAASALGLALGWEAAVLAGLAALAMGAVLLLRRSSRAPVACAPAKSTGCGCTTGKPTSA